jgi:Fe-S cluster assembly protein SufD
MNAALPSPLARSWQAAFDAQPSINTTQRRAYEAFLTRGLPTTKIDAWKYTDLRRFSMRQFHLPALQQASVAADAYLLPEMGSRRFIFIDGVLLPPTQQIPPGADVPMPADAFGLLNAAFAPGGVKIDIADNQVVDQPIYIAFVWTQAAQALMNHPHVRVTIGNSSSATLVEHHIGLNTEANFTNAVFDIQVSDQAALDHVRIQDDAVVNFNICNVHATVGRAASYRSFHYVLGGSLARADFRVELAGAEAKTELHGVVFAQQTQHLDIHTVVDHQVPNTTSVEDYRGIADDRGRIVFNGKVIVSKDAQRTDARQSSRNLLLSPQAEIDTRPELEIYANDVKCAHGATVGQLDATALFYLQSRGIARDEARALLTQAFAAEVIERIPVPAVREYVLSRLMTRMRSAGSTA